ELFGRRLAAEILQQLTLDAAELVDHLDHVDRNADGAGLVGHCAGDRLPDPPGGVGRELVTLGVVELLDRADQTQVAFLDEAEAVISASLRAWRSASDSSSSSQVNSVPSSSTSSTGTTSGSASSTTTTASSPTTASGAGAASFFAAAVLRAGLAGAALVAALL